jgi:hypothetical protein
MEVFPMATAKVFVPPFKRKVLYARAMTCCIAAHCLEDGDKPRIILCMDRRMDYGAGVGAHEMGWKFHLAGPGWSALIAGSVHQCHALLSLYRDHLGKTIVTGKNVWREMQVPLADFKKDILSEGFSQEDSVELLISGFVERQPMVFYVICQKQEESRAVQNVVQVDAFECIGSGSSLAQNSLLYRECGETTELLEALYYVYEAKRWSELDTSVNKRTVIIIQDPSDKGDAVALRHVSPSGMDILSDMFVIFGPQPYFKGPVTLRDLLH